MFRPWNPQPGPHLRQGARYGEPGRRDVVNQYILGFLGGAGVEDVLGVPKLNVSTRQVLVQPLHSLSVVGLWHPYPLNILRHHERGTEPL